jgi:hypothetical protein
MTDRPPFYPRGEDDRLTNNSIYANDIDNIKRIRRRIEDYIRKTEPEVILRLAVALKIKMT